MPAEVLTRARWRRCACVAAIALVAGLQSPAQADTRVFIDRAGDAATGTDLLRVRVVNEDRVRVRTAYENLHPGHSGGFSVYFDTNRRRPGPEYALSSGLGATRDWQAHRVRRWQFTSIVPCRVHVAVNHRRDFARGILDRDCLGGHRGRIRVAVQVRQGQDIDWLFGRHQFSDWVRR